LIKYDSFPATFRNQIRNLSYDLSKESTNFTTNLNNLSYELSKESTTNTNNLNNLSYDLSKESSNFNFNLNNLLYEQSKESANFTTNLNNLSYNLSKESIEFNVNTSLIYNYSPEIIDYDINFSLTYLSEPIDAINFRLSSSLNNVYTPESIDSIISTSLNYVYSPEIITFSLKPQVDYTTFKQSTNNSSNLSELTYNTSNETINETIGLSVDSIYAPEKSLVSQSLTGTELYSFTTDQATASKISFVPYDSSSNLTFNSSSLRHYVRQINEVFYMSGSQLTSSRINYQDDIELIVIGKGSTTTYKDNLDYNLPYRASFLVKNWPYYSYNTSSYWYLPVQLNASNDDILSSGDIWVTASFQNGTDVFTDQYGFAIDI
jgi:hypothetical protein